MRRIRRAILGSGVVLLSACTLLTQASDLHVGGSQEEERESGSSDAEPLVDAPSQQDVEVDAGPTRAALYREAILADSPLAYWRFDETSGVIAKDETNRYPGSYEDGPILGADGIFGKGGALQIGDATTAHVSVVSNVVRLAGTGPFTIEVWVLPRFFEDYEWIAGTERGPSQPRLGWSLLVNAQAAPSFEVWQPNDAGGSTQVRGYSLGNQAVVLNAWQHVVVTFDGTTHIGYVNGVAKSSEAFPAAIPAGERLMWGCRRGDMELIHCLDGWSLDEAAIYPTALSHARVLAHYNLGKL